MAANTQTTTLDNVRDAAGGRFERARTFLTEVRNELKRVTWPSQKEVYATTVVVILTSAFFGLYLFALDLRHQQPRAVDLPSVWCGMSEISEVAPGDGPVLGRRQEVVHRPHLFGVREEGRRVAPAARPGVRAAG